MKTKHNLSWHSGSVGFPPQWYLQHRQPGAQQRFIRIHLHLSCVGEHIQVWHSRTGSESTLCERKGGERADHSFYSLSYTYFQSGKASLLLRPVRVDFDCLAGPELLELCEPVASLTCTLASKYTADEAQRLSRKGSKDKSCSANQDLLSSL